MLHYSYSHTWAYGPRVTNLHVTQPILQQLINVSQPNLQQLIIVHVYYSFPNYKNKLHRHPSIVFM